MAKIRFRNVKCVVVPIKILKSIPNTSYCQQYDGQTQTVHIQKSCVQASRWKLSSLRSRDFIYYCFLSFGFEPRCVTDISFSFLLLIFLFLPLFPSIRTGYRLKVNISLLFGILLAVCRAAGAAATAAVVNLHAHKSCAAAAAAADAAAAAAAASVRNEY